MASIKGQAGTLLASGRVAARLAGWSGRASDGGCDITAFMRERNEYWLGSREFWLELSIGRRRFRWRDVDVERIGTEELHIVAQGEREDA